MRQQKQQIAVAETILALFSGVVTSVGIKRCHAYTEKGRKLDANNSGRPEVANSPKRGPTAHDEFEDFKLGDQEINPFLNREPET